MTRNSDELLRQMLDQLGVDPREGEVPGPGLPPGWPSVLEPRPQPELRRPRRDEPCLYRVRVDLAEAKPPIWRRLDLRSDLSLDVVHSILQAAFFWDDYHLHRFAIGDGVFGRGQEFLCPFDVDEGDGGIPEEDVRLDETLAAPGDRLHYMYDYGDGWRLRIRLEKVLELEPEAMPAVCLGGRRAAPPEDSRGATDEELAELLDDPEEFDADEVNALLDDQVPEPGPRLPPMMEELVDRVGFRLPGARLRRRIGALAARPAPSPARREKEAALVPHQWFLDRAAEGIPLTAAGWMAPDAVSAAAEVIPSAREWIGKKNREQGTIPVLHFRRMMQRFGLLHRHRGELRLTQVGRAAQHDVEVLWDQLASALPLADGDEFEHDVARVELLVIADSGESAADLSEVPRLLEAMLWTGPDGEVLPPSVRHSVIHSPSHLLAEVGEHRRSREADSGVEFFDPAVVALAREALHLDAPAAP
ncbi:plasmid pRiA4b ORF-3 family protein [Nesterenkonia halobia]